MSCFRPLREAELEWKDGAPFSKLFSDIYFPPENGWDASREVFLDPNKVESRLCEQSQVSIGEVGFGSGLNFFACFSAWRKLYTEEGSGRVAKLRFLSTELHPLKKHDFERISELNGVDSEALQVVLDYYPPAVQGTYRFSWFNGAVELHLLYGDARESLASIDASIDVWFMDGFSPKLNPELWQDEICFEIARLSTKGTSLSSFTSAGWVRNNLSEHNFQIKKIPGFANKKHSILAQYQPEVDRTEIGKTNLSPNNSSSALVIGSGVAGCSVADSLTRRGVRVTLVEASNSLTDGASGNRLAIALPYLGNAVTPLSEFYNRGFYFFVSRLREFSGDINYSKSGAIQLINCYRLKRLFEEFENLPGLDSLVRKIDSSQASDLAGVELGDGGFYLPDGYSIAPKAYCKSLLSSDQIGIIKGVGIEDLSWNGSQWCAFDKDGKLVGQADSCIVTTAWAAAKFKQLSWLPLEAVRGQCMSLKSFSESTKLRTLLCYDGYISPLQEGIHFVGSSYSHDDMETAVRDSDNESMISSLKAVLPLAAKVSLEVESARASFRTSTYDRLPYVGEIPGQENKGLYISAGFGSRGISTAGLAGEIIAAEITQDCCPYSTELKQSLAPERYLVSKRHLKSQISQGE